MSEDKVYKDGDIVWVKLGNNWWPGEVTGPARHPEGLITHLKRVPYCVVKFFNENTYEYVRSGKQIFPFQCPKQNEFIRKGYSLYNSGKSFMEKFPADVEVARQLVRRKESSLIINDRPDSIVKAILGQPLIRTSDECCEGSEQREKRLSRDSVTKILNITPNRNNDSLKNQQPKAQTCDFCDFTSVRLNVMILHRKIHSNKNALGTGNSASKQTPSSSTKSVGNLNVVGNIKKLQNQTFKNYINNKTKASTISTINAAPPRTPSPSSRLTPVNKTNTSNSANSIEETVAISNKEKNNGNMKFTTAKNISKTAKNSTIQEKKDENVYAAILSDLCPSGAETSSEEEEQSRYYLCHSKSGIEATAENLSTVCIDLPESKTIQKIPKKREYTTLQLESESAQPTISSAILEDPDVVCLSDKEKEISASSTSTGQANTVKKDAEDIRRMLLADWSDDDETPADTGLIDESVVLVNNEDQDCLATAKEFQNAASVATTSTPLLKSSTTTTGRIRNIPKKDRRDIVLQDFNSDLSYIQHDNTDHETNKTVAVDLDSSNSSVVEIIEEPPTASIITINDDEEQEISKPQKNQDDATFAESKANESLGFLTNDKPASAATSTSTLSCFDFQDDEDEHDNTATTISHFKKKFLSGEKLQNLLSNTTEDLKDNNVAKNRAELAEKDQRLAADIESLLEQTQPTVVDLLNASSFEESLSVKDLPIKERGKRIFKSRNKTRLAGKTNTELSTGVEKTYPAEPETKEEDKTNTADEVECENNQSETNAETSPTGKCVEMAANTDDLINSRCLRENSSQHVLLGTQAEIPNCLEEPQLPPNNNEVNETSAAGGNKDYLEISTDEGNILRNEQSVNDKLLTSDSTNENLNFEKQSDNIEEVQEENNINEAGEQLQQIQDVSINQQDELDRHSEEENSVAMGQTQTAAQEIITDKSNEILGGMSPNDEAQSGIEPHFDDNELCKAFHVPASGFNDERIKDKPLEKVKVLEVQIFKQSQANLENNLVETYADGIMVEKTTSQIITDADERPTKMLGTGTSNKVDENEVGKRSSENAFKIRVKSPEKLLDQAFVVASQDQELQRIADIGVEAGLVSTTPTDENSSMGASDTGAEFGSPTSMLSEERLPAFRFQNNRTPQPEVETAEASDTLMHSASVVISEVAKKGSGDSHTDQPLIKQPLLRDKSQNDQIREQKSLQVRRYSMDVNSLQTELKSIKRQRLSVDDITDNQVNNFEITLNKLITGHGNKIEIKVRPKSRHMKITPRRNVSELFREHNEKHIKDEAGKCESLMLSNETQFVNNVISSAETKMDQLIQSRNVSPVKENSNEVFNKKLENITKVIRPNKENHTETSDNNVLTDATENEDLEIPTDHEVLTKLSEEKQNNLLTENTCAETEITNKEECKSKPKIQVKPNLVSCTTKVLNNVGKKIEEAIISTEENQQENFKPNLDESMLLKNGSIEIMNVVNTSDKDSNHAAVANEISLDIPVLNAEINDETGERSPKDTLVLDDSETQKGQLLENPFTPEIATSTLPDHEVAIERTQLETPASIDSLSEIALLPLTPQENDNSLKTTNQILETTNKALNESEKKENRALNEADCPLATLGKDSSADSSEVIPTTEIEKPNAECEALVDPSTSQQSLDLVIEFDNSLPMPGTPRKRNTEDESNNIVQIPSTTQAKDLIIECEPSTPQSIIECDHNLPTQITPEKEVVIESDVASDKRQDIIIEGNLRLDDRETLLEREFQVIQPKESVASIDIPQEPQTNSLQIDADKAAQEFLIEFDSIVNHSHTVEEEVQNSTVEDALNAEDLINNIIEEVHEEPLPKEDTVTKNDPPIQFEPLNTYAVVANKNSWQQICKDTFNKQLNTTSKRRQTICFEISDTKEGVACKKQAFDFGSILPVNKTLKRTAERKLTLPAIETKLFNSNQPHTILAFNHNQITVTKKISTTKRKLSIEDNITPFIIERPKKHPVPNVISGPPPLQRIRPIRRQSHISTKPSLDSMSEPPPLQSHDNLLNDLFPTESSASTQGMDTDQKVECGRVSHPQMIRVPTPPSISAMNQNKNTDSKITMNKQIGVDSRGNKYVIIKTPPTDIVVQPTLTSSTASTVPATSNFGTTITFQPLARSSSELCTSKPTLQQQQMKQISIAVPGKSTLEVSNSPEVSAKTAIRNRRKAAQAKAVAAAATTASNNNVNSAKHRQAMEALSRRLSIASEAPPLAKISRTSSANVQTQFSSNSNLSTLFGDAQISNIAQQQLIQLQQQQQTTQQTSASSPALPPVILNKNAHQQSVIQRKTRKLPTQQQTHLQHQQLAVVKPSQMSPQQNSMQQQSQQLQPQIIAQIALQQQPQQHNPLQPPPLQQIQQPTEPIQQHIVQPSDGVNITTTAAEDDDVIISNSQLIALSTQPYPGYPNTFLLCKVKGNTYNPVDNVPLYLNEQLNELLPLPLEAIESGHKTQEAQIEIKPSNATQQLLAGQSTEPQDGESNIQIANINCNLVDDEMSASIDTEHQLQTNQQHQIMEECVVDENGATGSSNQICDFAGSQELNTELVSNDGILLNIEGQQVLLDAATFAHLLANPDANTQLISDDGTEYVLTHEVLQALQMQQEQQQALELLNAAAEQHQQLEQTASNDIIAVALAGSDLYDNDVLTIDTSQGMQLIDGDGSIVFPAQTGSITQQHLTPPAVVTNAVLDQSPIMSTLEVPSSLATAHKLQGTQLITVPSHHLATSSNAALGLGGRANLEDSLAAIGVTTQSSSIPSSLGLPITVTNPNIASKVTSAGPLNEMLQFVSHRPATAAATAAAVAAAALAGESRIFTD